MNKANLARDARGREDPKSLVLRTIPNLCKSFRPEVKKAVYWIEETLDEDEHTVTDQLLIFDDLQQVVDVHFVDYPVLRPYASFDLIQEEIARNKNIPIAQLENRKAKDYWECGGCVEDYVHTWEEETCPKCHDVREAAYHARLEDVIAYGLPIDWAAQEQWEKEQTDPAEDSAA